MNKLSELKPYSIGMVAANKPLNSRIIEVVTNEDSSMLSGQVTDNVDAYEAEGVDAQGENYQEALAATSTKQAEWLPLGSSNRMTPPDVRRGESVIVYKFADQDKYYWVTLMDDMRLRKLETAIYAWSATTDESKDTDASSSYFFEVSTHKKLVTFHTSDANAEATTFDFQLNTAEGTFQIQDGFGNHFFFDGPNRVLKMENMDGTSIEINQKNAKWLVPELLQVFGKRGEFKFQQWDITCPKTTHDGNLIEKGAFTLAGDMKTQAGGGGAGDAGTGEIEIAGRTKLLGSMDVEGPLTAVTVAASESVTAPNLRYT